MCQVMITLHIIHGSAFNEQYPTYKLCHGNDNSQQMHGFIQRLTLMRVLQEAGTVPTSSFGPKDRSTNCISMQLEVSTSILHYA